MSVNEPQSAQSVLMVRPASFGFNPQTAATNAFQRLPGVDPPRAAAVLREFDAAADMIRGAGVQVIVADDTAAPVKPDAIFPNNWVSFHADGTVVLYPMLAANRRWERREELIAQVAEAGPFRISRTIDLSPHEARGQYLEGTGSMVLDRSARTAYACLSPRTHLDALGDFAQQLDYELLTFDAADAAGVPIYHTNVLMAVGTRFAVVCSEAIGASTQRGAVLARLQATGHEIIEITPRQMHEFAGNVLELKGADGPVAAVSTTAWRALDSAQRSALEKHVGIVCVDIPVIERSGGGGVRCMLAEVHLPKRG
ncbi:MAG: citrulline utilization hydrolase CtlX [Steroidobacterales bacterium]